MPYGPHVVSQLEDALSEAFQFHRALDAFVRRSGISENRLNAARVRAEERAKQSASKFSRAPKRFVVQELFANLGDGTEVEDRLVASLITELCKGTFSDATPAAKQAIETLKAQRLAEHQEADVLKAKQHEEERSKEREREKALAESAKAHEEFKERFLELSQQTNPQARGYALERFLNDYLKFEGLNPRGSFKLVGEQIDGSFDWNGRTYLVEAKWISTPVGGAEFSSLMYKIEGKTADTRGLFISINGYSPQAVQGLRGKGELRFVCIDGAHMIHALAHNLGFLKVLEVVWRHANETGEAYLPVASQGFLDRRSQ